MFLDKSSITGVILSGGDARRMGGRDKGLVKVNARPMIEYVITGMQPQVSTIIINANRHHDIYARYAYPVIADELEGFSGPLAGMASCLHHIDTEYMLTAPCDSPCFPADLVSRLSKKLLDEDTDISVAHDGNRIQPVFTLIRCTMLDSMLDYLSGGDRKVDLWFGRHNVALADFSDKPETFININTPEDINRIETELVKA